MRFDELKPGHSLWDVAQSGVQLEKRVDAIERQAVEPETDDGSCLELDFFEARIVHAAMLAWIADRDVSREYVDKLLGKVSDFIYS